MFVTAKAFWYISTTMELLSGVQAMRNGTKNCQGEGEGLGVDMMNIKRLGLCDMYYPTTINDSL